MGFLKLWRMGATLYYGLQAFHCCGFSCCRAQALKQGSAAVVYRLSCPTVCGIFFKPMSPALACRFLTTGLPGRSDFWTLGTICHPVNWWAWWKVKDHVELTWAIAADDSQVQSCPGCWPHMHESFQPRPEEPPSWAQLKLLTHRILSRNAAVFSYYVWG